MIRYAVDRVFTAIPLLLIVGLFAFLLVNLMPGDAASTIAGEGASATQVESVREDLGLNQPMYAQFFDWVGGVVQGDFGTSFAYNTSVSYLIIQRLEVTISLVALGFVLTVVLGIALGVLSGRNVALLERGCSPLSASLSV
ncbi:ABC transporter permease [Brevibacterium jeotgali]|uniref:Peptide/nickel transport system permease protein n=1 Tax=Brevibacterium jeotgali TaxID=1262550 RepID=A0A2H1L961_9MICO|nr:ABC transporter permease [Brevibacterium jeotgali]SMY13320.1 peptide/nickel transport system permease protein [Brevibacterium jeotgali]